MHKAIAFEDDGDQGNGDSAKPLGGWLNLVSMPCLLSCWCRRCCAMHLWEISNVYDNDDFERSPTHLYLVLYSTRWWKQNNGSAGFKN